MFHNGTVNRMLVIADDLTGALDTGMQFAKTGARTLFLWRDHFDRAACEKADVIIVDTETRHLGAQEAYRIVYELAEAARDCGIDIIYKKTDSGLRGNFSHEIPAVMDACGCEECIFVPAFPEMNRTVRDGISYIDDVPVSRSIFGQDPQNPVLHDRVVDLFGEYAGIAEEFKNPSEYEAAPRAQRRIAVFDSASAEDVRAIWQAVRDREGTRCYAGCASFAGVIAGEFGKGRAAEPLPRSRFIVACGSINDISKRQIACAEKAGLPLISLTSRELSDPDFLSSERAKDIACAVADAAGRFGVCMLDTGERMPEKSSGESTAGPGAAATAGRLAQMICREDPAAVYMIIGGDTLYSFSQAVHCKALELTGEPEQGTVLTKMYSDFGELNVLTKSGGFGKEDLIVSLYNRIHLGGTGSDAV